MSECVTNGIRIQVRTQFLPAESDATQQRFIFAYRIHIANESDVPAKLETRHWIITDAWGREEHVRGPGVVGETPRLEPGQGFEYTSFCPLPTPTGQMRGSFQMVRDDGARFDAQVATFYLIDPAHLN